MYLKKIEIFGFKSFAEKTVIELNNNISAIVGPNGSGKSNISDAIRWVMGEQSIKNLRGNKLEDVIFAGSEKRKPLGYAQVSLVLDNSDGFLPLNYSEIAITRKFYRSGESVFLINNNECRLKDIQELMLDTGLGKEAYSIIGQGRVEEILNNNPQERRIIFEEAAGIVKYQIRQKEAAKKLATAEQNFLRLNDLTQEIGSQLPYLEEQADKASKYKEIENKLNELEKRIILKEWNESFLMFNNYQESLNNWCDKLSLVEVELVNEELNGEQQQRNLLELEQFIAKKQEEREDFINKQSLLETRIEVGKEKRHSWRETIERLELEIGVQNQQLEVWTAKEEIEKDKYLTLKNNVFLIKQDLLTKESAKNQLKYCLDNLAQKLEENKEELIDLLNELAKSKNQLQRINLESTQLKKSLEKYNTQYMQVLAHKTQLSQDTEQLRKRFEQSQLKQVKNKEQLKQLEEDFSQREEKIIALSSQKTKIEENMKILSTRLRTLEELEKQKAGYNQGVKAIINAKDQNIRGFTGIYGAVVDLIKVIPGYELALETALGAGLQYIVTENEEIAQSAVNFLKQGKLGRVTFLPLDLLIPGQTIVLEDLKEKYPGLLGTALEKISFEAKYAKAIKFVLNRVLIAKDLNTAVQVSRQIPKNGRVVTVDGDLVSAAGTITGGSWQKGKGNGLLERKREIDQNKTKVIGFAEHLKQIEQEIEQQQQVFKLVKDEISDLEEEIVEERIKTDGLLQEIKHNNFLIKQDQDKLELLELESKHCLEQVEQLNSEKKRQQEEVMNKEQLISENKINYGILKAELEAGTISYSQSEQGNTELKVKLAILEERLSAYEQNWKLAEGMIVQTREKLNSIQFESSKLANDFKLLSEELNVLESQMTDLIDQNLELEQLLKQSLQKRNDQFAIWQLTEQKLKTFRKRQGELQKKINEQEVKTAEYDTEIKHLNQELRERYKIDDPLSLIINNPNLIELENEAVDRVKQLKQFLEEMQPVNLNSLEEYARVNERYEFLQQQKDDLVQAKKNLFKVVQEMEIKMEKQFVDTVNKIKTNFQLVYNQLFGGGNAELSLINEDNPLSSGIEIIAQPPGKKHQNLNLLSGGEKALTAIALLFAILRVKKSPFSVLDEIDSALDDANIQRFTSFLSKHAPKGQYIIITHKKGTMTIADNLYGLTMEEAGVSKIISIKLTDKGRAAV